MEYTGKVGEWNWEVEGLIHLPEHEEHWTATASTGHYSGGVLKRGKTAEEAKEALFKAMGWNEEAEALATVALAWGRAKGQMLLGQHIKRYQDALFQAEEGLIKAINEYEEVNPKEESR